MKNFNSYQNKIVELLHSYCKGYIGDGEFIDDVDNIYKLNNNINMFSLGTGFTIGIVTMIILTIFING